MTTTFRKQDFRVEGSGSYVCVFQRPGENVLIECCFFGENMTVQETVHRHKAMTDAIALGQEWDKEPS